MRNSSQENISRETLDLLANKIEECLHTNVVDLPAADLKDVFESVANIIAAEKPRLDEFKSAIDAATEKIKSSQDKSQELDKEVMKSGLDAASQAIDKIKGKFSERVMAEKKSINNQLQNHNNR